MYEHELRSWRINDYFSMLIVAPKCKFARPGPLDDGVLDGRAGRFALLRASSRKHRYP